MDGELPLEDHPFSRLVEVDGDEVVIPGAEHFPGGRFAYLPRAPKNERFAGWSPRPVIKPGKYVSWKILHRKTNDKENVNAESPAVFCFSVMEQDMNIRNFATKQGIITIIPVTE
jgi:hypothetical protein